MITPEKERELVARVERLLLEVQSMIRAIQRNNWDEMHRAKTEPMQRPIDTEFPAAGGKL